MRTWLAVLTLGLATLAAACSGDKKTVTPLAEPPTITSTSETTPTRTVTATPQPTRTPSGTLTPRPTTTGTPTPKPTTTGTPTPVATTEPGPDIHPSGTRVDIAVVDTVLNAVESADAGALGSLVEFQSIVCAVDPSGTGIPGKPRCPDGVADGTPIDVFLTGNCDTAYGPATDSADLLAGFIADRPGLYAVYRRPGASDLVAGYTILFASGPANDRSARSLLVSETGIVAIFPAQCDQPPREIVKAPQVQENLVLAPPGEPLPTPPPPSSVETHPAGTRTGVEIVDLVLDAVEAGDAGQIAFLLHGRSVPCAVEPAGGFPQSPQCRPNEADGTLVDVVVERQCEGIYRRLDEVDLAPFARIGGLYAVGNLPTAVPGDFRYALVFLTDRGNFVPPRFTSLELDAVGIISYGPGCEGLLQFLLPDTAELILPPIEGSETPIPTPTTTAVPTQPAGARTGIASIDDVLDAFESANVTAVEGLVIFTKVPCAATPPDGIPQPPRCRGDVPDGTPIDVLPSAQCEGFFVLPDDVDLSGLIQDGRVYAAIRVANPSSGAQFPSGAYQVILARPLAPGTPEFGMTLNLDNTGIVSINYGCAQPVENFLPENEDDILLAPVS